MSEAVRFMTLLAMHEGGLADSESLLCCRLPMFNEARVALLFAQTLQHRMPLGCLRHWEEGKVPSEVSV